MQPNQNIPEYLHMEPIPEPKSRKKPFLIIALVGLLIVIGIVGALIFLFMQQNTPEEKFYRALSNLTHTSYVERKVTTNEKNRGEKTEITIESDFSNPVKTKSKASYHFQPTNAATDNIQRKYELKGDQIVVYGEATVARLSFKSALLPTPYGLNKWYKLDNGDLTNLYDPLGLRFSVNSNVAQVVMGNFTDSQSIEITNYIRANKIYTINSHDSDDKDGKNYTHYDVTVDYKKMAQLNKKINEQLKINQVISRLLDSNKAEFWIDNSTNQIVKINEVSKVDRNKVDFSQETVFKYPDSIKIDIPSSISVPLRTR